MKPPREAVLQLYRDCLRVSGKLNAPLYTNHLEDGRAALVASGHTARSQPTPTHSLCTSTNQSARRIPTQEQREIWLAYTRGKFKENRRVTDLRLKRAYEDGQEQLGRMNYFHEVREKKELQQQQQQHNPHHHPRHHHHSHPHPPPPVEPTPAAPTGSAWRLADFLHAHIPGINAEDLHRYEEELRKDGFDSLPMLQNHLEKEDLASWKKAHRRALLQVLAALKE